MKATMLGTATWLETTSDSVWTMIKDFTEMVKYLRVLLLLTQQLKSFYVKQD